MNTPVRTVLTLNKRSQDENTASTLEERLQKVLANAGLGSRRLLESRIEAGEIKVNGQIAKIGWNVRSGDRVELDSKLFVAINDYTENAKVLVYHKPEGVITTRDDPEGRPTIFEQLPRLKGARWIAVGRLDITTTGLLLLTTDGALAHALMHPSAEIEREYICRIHGEVSDEVMDRLRVGIELEDGPARFNELAIISRGDSHSWFRLVIAEGRNREVRRMWESQGLMVSRLKRIRYGTVELPRALAKGKYDPLDPMQIKVLRESCGAYASSPTLTLQPVIGQRRAKPGNEFRPEPRSQQAWTGSKSEESHEFRQFDRIRDEQPFIRAGKRDNPHRNKKISKSTLSREHHSTRPQRAGQKDRGFQPRTWFAGDSPTPATYRKPRLSSDNRNPAYGGNFEQSSGERTARLGRRGGAIFGSNEALPQQQRMRPKSRSRQNPNFSPRPGTDRFDEQQVQRRKPSPYGNQEMGKPRSGMRSQDRSTSAYSKFNEAGAYHKRQAARSDDRAQRYGKPQDGAKRNSSLNRPAYNPGHKPTAPRRPSRKLEENDQ